jgi:hypothetical protein
MRFSANLQMLLNYPRGRTGYRGVTANRGGYRAQLWYQVLSHWKEIDERAGHYTSVMQCHFTAPGSSRTLYNLKFSGF